MLQAYYQEKFAVQTSMPACISDVGEQHCEGSSGKIVWYTTKSLPYRSTWQHAEKKNLLTNKQLNSVCRIYTLPQRDNEEKNKQ